MSVVQLVRCAGTFDTLSCLAGEPRAESLSEFRGPAACVLVELNSVLCRIACNIVSLWVRLMGLHLSDTQVQFPESIRKRS